MSISFLHVSDLHLGAPFSFLQKRGKIRLRQKEHLAVLDWIGETAKQKEVDFVVFCGDQFHTISPPRTCLEAFRDLLEELEGEGIRSFMIAGNHDFLGKPSRLYEDKKRWRPCVFFDSPWIEEPYRFCVGGEEVYIYGFSYVGGVSSQRELDDFQSNGEEGFHIALIHGTVLGGELAQREVSAEMVPLRLEQLSRSGMDYIALGHFHRFRKYLLEGGGVAAYAGSPLGLSFREGELGRRYVLYVRLEAGKGVEVEPLEVRGGEGVRLEERVLELPVFRNLEEVVDWIVSRDGFSERERSSRMVHFQLKSSQFWPEEDLIDLLERRYFHVRLSCDFRPISWESVEELASGSTLMGRCFRRIFRQMESGRVAKEVGERALAILWGYFEGEEEG